MFMSKEQKPLDDDARFDRLVDGALSPAQYKAFVAALDDEPGGWRRCALAFLEAQAWGKEFAAIRRIEQDPTTAAQKPTEIKASGRARKLLAVGPLVCAAASLVLAFTLGLFAHGRFGPGVAERQM